MTVLWDFASVFAIQLKDTMSVLSSIAKNLICLGFLEQRNLLLVIVTFGEVDEAHVKLY